MNTPPQIHCASATHVGRVRSRNEDCVHTDPELGLLAIADGMGGHNAGHIASRLAIDSLIAHLQLAAFGKENTRGPRSSDAHPQTATEVLQLLGAAVAQANAEVFTAANTLSGCHGMGTTLLAAWIHSSNDGTAHLAIAHVGDSRLYRHRPPNSLISAVGELKQLTRDHTTLQEFIDDGITTAEDAHHLMRRSYLTRALGVERNLKTDLFDLPFSSDELLLLCSDGLTSMLSDPELLALLDDHRTHAGDSLQALADRLVEAANAHGGHDNISVVLATFA